MHKGWLEKLYNELNLSDRKIGKIYGINHKTIGYWRKQHKIDTKEEIGYTIDERGYKRVLMPLDYKHPQIKSTSSGRQRVREHRLVMENFLRKNSNLEISKKYLINGKYLDTNTVVHHINHDKLDNRIENLWVYPNHATHHYICKNSENQCLSALIKLGQINFNHGKYEFNSCFDYRYRYNKEQIQEIIKPVEFKVPFEDIDEIKVEIKSWEWYKISQNWVINKHHFYNRHQSDYVHSQIKINPYKDSDENSNPLYMHPDWVERIVNDHRFNLTDSRLAELCGISKGMAQYWRDRVHNISTKNTRIGITKYIDSDGYIRIKVTNSYKNPFVRELEMPYNTIQEHIYIAERNLAKSSNLNLKNKYLLNGKYLLPKYKVHHINLDKLDNRIENLFITDKHEKIHEQLLLLINPLFKAGFLKFKKGRYFLSYVIVLV